MQGSRAARTEPLPFPFLTRPEAWAQIAAADVHRALKFVVMIFLISLP
jgi:hypothetical protein